jgi:hypothetical protein
MNINTFAAHRSDLSFHVIVWAVAGLAAGSSVVGQTAVVRPILLDSPSAMETANVLPSSQAAFQIGSDFVCEIWATTGNGSGLSSISVDVSFDPGIVSAGAITHAPLFSALPNGTIGPGLVDNLSGSHLGACTDAVGVSPTWARVAVVDLTAVDVGIGVVQLLETGNPAYGSAICGVGDIDPQQVLFGSAGVQITVTGIPTLSAWGIVALFLLTATAGSVIASRRGHRRAFL